MDYSSIISTLAYFHIFDYPLTSFEIWKFLFQENNSGQDKISLLQIEQTLQELKGKNVIKEKNGFYYLNIKKSENDTPHDIIQTRVKRNRIAEKKYEKALRIIKILRFVPTIKMIAVCNTLSYNNAKETSDIDLFIITKEGSIWITRLLVAGILKLLRLRPLPENSRDKICASFFISENNLDLETIQIGHSFPKSANPAVLQKEKRNISMRNNSMPFDIYLIYWIIAIVPIYDKEKTYKKFLEKNLWIKKYLLNPTPYLTNPERTLKPKKSFLYVIFSFLTILIPGKFAKKIQMRIMPSRLRQIANKDTRVILNNSMLKFHDKDRREEYYDKWIEIM